MNGLVFLGIVYWPRTELLVLLELLLLVEVSATGAVDWLAMLDEVPATGPADWLSLLRLVVLLFLEPLSPSTDLVLPLASALFFDLCFLPDLPEDRDQKKLLACQ